MIKISHKKQKNDGYNWKCGAACLEMIFERRATAIPLALDGGLR